MTAESLMKNRHFWHCNVCDAQNSREDGECQFCECEGPGKCKRDSCSGPCVEMYDAPDGSLRFREARGEDK